MRAVIFLSIVGSSVFTGCVSYHARSIEAPLLQSALRVLDDRQLRSFIETNAESGAVGVYVGPQSRVRFGDVDKDVLDSIKDILEELRGRKRLRIVTTRQDAQIILEVLSGRTESDRGSAAVAAPIERPGTLIPIGTIGMATIMRVGAYEKRIVFQNCRSRRHCARRVAKYVETWAAVNPTVGGRR
jgi:hypothetical protein